MYPAPCVTRAWCKRRVQIRGESARERRCVADDTGCGGVTCAPPPSTPGGAGREAEYRVSLRERRCVADTTGCGAAVSWAVPSVAGGAGRDAEYRVSLNGASRSRT
ncbi:hypothetical protein V495_02676 [Pseudogymnoascus sp. VKM F-4514 (FW-929)]|nr:hypothetical protein V495_02676 [Pseudogymnoascus sp. VKM F-4514 (FW-929)]